MRHQTQILPQMTLRRPFRYLVCYLTCTAALLHLQVQTDLIQLKPECKMSPAVTQSIYLSIYSSSPCTEAGILLQEGSLVSEECWVLFHRQICKAHLDQMSSPVMNCVNSTLQFLVSSFQFVKQLFFGFYKKSQKKCDTSQRRLGPTAWVLCPPDCCCFVFKRTIAQTTSSPTLTLKTAFFG